LYKTCQWLTIKDDFSGWVDILPVANLSAKLTAKVLIDYFLQKSFPTSVTLKYPVIHSDVGTQFTAALTKQTLSLLGVKATYNLPFNANMNGSVENAHRVIFKCLRRTLGCHVPSRAWQKVLPVITTCINNLPSPSRSHLSARDVIFGTTENPTILDFLMGKVTSQTGQISSSREVNSKFRDISKTHHEVHASLEKHKAQYKRSFDKHHKVMKDLPPAGCMVFKKVLVLPVGIASKIASPFFAGPFLSFLTIQAL